MGIYLSEQTLVFAQSLLVGAALGALYDVFRISRVAFGTSSGVIFAEDVLFFAICGVVTFLFGLTAIDGVLRFFLIIGELLGAIIYHLTIGRLVMGVSRKIIHALIAAYGFILKWIFHPVWMFFYHITALIMRPFIFLSRIFKKKLQNTKFRLKIRRKVLYNQLTGYMTVKGAAKRRKVQGNGKTRKAGRERKART